MRRAILPALLLPLAASAAPAELTPEQAERRLARLAITPAQAEALVPLLDEAAALRLEQCLRIAELAPETAEAWDDLRAIVAVDGTPDPEVWRRAKAASEALREDRDLIVEGLAQLEVEARDVLTPAQRAQLDRSGRGAHGALREELDSLAAQRRPTLSRLGRALQEPAIAAELYALAEAGPPPVLGEAGAACDAVDPTWDELRQLRDEITSWNLLNGLHLQAGQAAALLDLAGGEGAEGAVEALLDPGQVEVLRGFSPCLLPPRDLSEPVRAGQAGGGDRYERWLERARRLDADGQDRAVARLLEGEERQLGPLPPGREAEVRGVLAAASAVDEVGFALIEDDLLDQLAREDMLHEARLALLDAQQAAGGPGVAAHFMLDPAFLEVTALRFGEGGAP